MRQAESTDGRVCVDPDEGTVSIWCNGTENDPVILSLDTIETIRRVVFLLQQQRDMRKSLSQIDESLHRLMLREPPEMFDGEGQVKED